LATAQFGQADAVNATALPAARNSRRETADSLRSQSGQRSVGFDMGWAPLYEYAMDE
jgi:hypothetical protein